jgi:hypothetical protein
MKIWKKKLNFNLDIFRNFELFWKFRFEILKFYCPPTHSIYWTPYPWYFDPLPMVYRPSYSWYIDPPTHGILTLLPMALGLKFGQIFSFHHFISLWIEILTWFLVWECIIICYRSTLKFIPVEWNLVKYLVVTTFFSRVTTELQSAYVLAKGGRAYVSLSSLTR